MSVFKDKQEFERQYREMCMAEIGKKFEDLTNQER